MTDRLIHSGTRPSRQSRSSTCSAVQSLKAFAFSYPLSSDKRPHPRRAGCRRTSCLAGHGSAAHRAAHRAMAHRRTCARSLVPQWRLGADASRTVLSPRSSTRGPILRLPRMHQAAGTPPSWGDDHPEDRSSTSVRRLRQWSLGRSPWISSAMSPSTSAKRSTATGWRHRDARRAPIREADG